MTIRSGWLLLPVLLGVSGCVSPIPPLDTSRLSPLEVRAMETRAYDSHDVKLTLKTVLNVLQDEGFLVDYGNADLGLLHANKTISQTADQQSAPAIAAWDLNGTPSLGVPSPRGRVSSAIFSTVEATANVSEFGNQVRVRINFQRKIFNWQGLVISATPISDPKSYQEFFAKLDRGLFIQKQGI